MEVNIMGTIYTITYKSINEDSRLEDLEGYVDLYQKEIVIAKVEERDYFEGESKKKMQKVKNKVLRHEIIHAFMYESGLDSNSNKSYSWAENEEMIDWFAIQSPKIYKVYKELHIL